MSKYFRIIALSALAALFAASCSKSDDIEDYQDFILDKYESVSSVNQLVYVECLEGSNASVSFSKKTQAGIGKQYYAYRDILEKTDVRKPLILR